MDQLGELEGNVDGPAQRCESFGPGTLPVESVGLDETDSRVGRCSRSQLPQPRIIDLGRGVQEDLRVLRGRVQVGMLDQHRGHPVHVVVNERQKPRCCQEDSGRP